MASSRRHPVPFSTYFNIVYCSRLVTAVAGVLLLCSVGTSSAATTTKRASSVVSTTLPSIKKSTIMHPAFKDAGKKVGLQIWRIENFEPVPYPEKDYGKFHSGDSYIVLNTKQNGKDKLSWDIHFWLGKETSQDEAGSAAILSVELDDGLGGAPVQYRETQEHESELFSSYFKNGVRYLPGGVASGFHHSEINPSGGKKLYQVKGKKSVRVTQVVPDVKSMNQGDVFILDSGKEIFVYVGSKAKGTEKLKAISAANEIRDQDHNGRAHVTVIDGSSTAEEKEGFFKELGSGSEKQVADAAATDDDGTYETKQDATVSLYKVSDSSGKLTLEKVNQTPLQQSSLKTDDCFILDTATSGLYVWIGKKGTVQEKVEALKHAQNFLTTHNYPSWTHVVRVVEGAEPAAFRQYFREWRESSVGLHG